MRRETGTPNGLTTLSSRRRASLSIQAVASSPAAANGTLAPASGTQIVATPQQKRAAARGQGSPAYVDLLARPPVVV